MAESTPALVRGIQLLRLLGDGEERTLEEIARQSDLPKSSVCRLLETLTQLGLAARDPETKRYRALAVLTPRVTSVDLAQRLREALTRLAVTTGQTAEWYVPNNTGMVLVNRAEPPGQEVRVIARIGYLRSWHDELEAVAAVGHAYWPEIADADERERAYTIYAADGVRALLSEVEARRRISSARERGWASDAFLNSNGVRRLAAVVQREGRPTGVLALAAFARPGDTATTDELLAAVRDAAAELSC